MKPTPEAVALALLMMRPAGLWGGATNIVGAFRAGPRYPRSSWISGLDGSNFKPDINSCDWLIQYYRGLGFEPEVSELEEVERYIREGFAADERV